MFPKDTFVSAFSASTIDVFVSILSGEVRSRVHHQLLHFLPGTKCTVYFVAQFWSLTLVPLSLIKHHSVFELPSTAYSNSFKFVPDIKLCTSWSASNNTWLFLPELSKDELTLHWYPCTDSTMKCVIKLRWSHRKFKIGCFERAKVHGENSRPKYTWRVPHIHISCKSIIVCGGSHSSDFKHCEWEIDYLRDTVEQTLLNCNGLPQ